MRVVITMTPVVVLCGVSCGRFMAGRAWEIAVNGQDAVIKKFFPQCKSFPAQGIAVEIINRCRPSGWNIETDPFREKRRVFFAAALQYQRSANDDDKQDKNG